MCDSFFWFFKPDLYGFGIVETLWAALHIMEDGESTYSQNYSK